MCRDRFRPIALGTAAAIVGWLGWSGNVLLLPVAVLFPALWSLARSRLQAGLVAACYFLTASRGLPQGVANFYASDICPGLLLWLTASTGFVIVHSVLWTKHAGWRRPFFYLIACAVMAIPPFGITGWAHPITAAGVLFPAWGWAGLLALAVGLSLMTTRLRSAAGIAMSCLWLWSATEWAAPDSPTRWTAVDLRMGASLGRDVGLDRQQVLIEIARDHPPGTTIVLPESTIGFWTPTVARFWRTRLAGTGISVIAGAAVIDEDGYDNVLVEISAMGSRVLYRERMPVPGSMWRPWENLISEGGGARAHFFENPVVEVGGSRAAPLICYEQLLVWPILHSLLHSTDVIIAVGNGWWAAGTSIVDIQRASSEAWARLFDLPLVTSFNT